MRKSDAEILRNNAGTFSYIEAGNLQTADRLRLALTVQKVADAAKSASEWMCWQPGAIKQLGCSPRG